MSTIFLGPFEITAFTAWIMLGVGLGTVLALYQGWQQAQPLLAWLDVLLVAVVGGVLGARALHVVIHWEYFAAHTDEIIQLQRGGFDWHGAVLVGTLLAWLVARLRQVDLMLFTDALALAVPLGAMAFWQACIPAQCAYGLEVRTLADYPAWLVAELPDIYGDVAPRLNLPLIGIALAFGIGLIIVFLMWRGWLRGLRLWFGLILLGLGMAVIDMFRADYVPQWFDRRADHILDLVIVLFATLSFALVAIRRNKGADEIA